MACCRPTGLQSLALLALGEDVHRHGAQEHKTLDRLHHCGVDAHDRQALVDDAHDQCADNGAGKSTLVHVLAGLEQLDAGSIAVGGETVRLDGVAKAIDLGIAPAFQQPQFCENLDVSANIFLGREMRQGFASRDDEGMYNKAREVLNTLSTSVRAGQSIASLSGGQRQTIAIARTLLNDPSLIVLDEPTASLSVTQTAEVLDYIVRLRSDDRSVIMVCHDLPNVFAVADRIVVMRLGEIRAVHNTSETSYEEDIAEIAGVGGSGTTPSRPCERASRARMPIARESHPRPSRGGDRDGTMA